MRCDLDLILEEGPKSSTVPVLFVIFVVAKTIEVFATQHLGDSKKGLMRYRKKQVVLADAAQLSQARQGFAEMFEDFQAYDQVEAFVGVGSFENGCALHINLGVALLCFGKKVWLDVDIMNWRL